MTAYTTLKTAVIPPTPSAIVIRAVAVTIGVRENRRNAWRMSRISTLICSLGAVPRDIEEEIEPEPQSTLVPGAIAVETCHLRAVLLQELTRVKPQQTPVEADAKGLASHVTVTS